MDKLTIEHSVALTTILCALLYRRRLQFSQAGNLYFVDVLTDVHFVLYNWAYFAGLVFMFTQLSTKKGYFDVVMCDISIYIVPVKKGLYQPSERVELRQHYFSTGKF